MKLRLKSTILPYNVDGEVVLKVGGQFARIPDKDGAMWTLTQALDGSLTTADLLELVCSKHPSADRAHVSSIITDFINHRMVELPEEELSTSISAHIRERVSRNFDFFGSLAAFGENKFSFQERLRQANICVLGCGGLGTHVLYELAAVGAHRLTILDFDKIELSNLNRQILYKEEDIGSVKVETAKRRLLEFNSDLIITTHHRRLESTGDVSDVVKNHDIVICIADKPANYIGDWLNEACVSHKIPFITGGLDVRRAVFFSVQPGFSGCEVCWYTAARSGSPVASKILEMNKNDNITYERPAPAFVPLVAVTAGIMVSEAVKYVTGCQPPSLTNKLKAFSFDDFSIEVAETWERNIHCRICGTKQQFPESLRQQPELMAH